MDNWIDIAKQKPDEGQAIIAWVNKPSSPPNIKTGIYYEWRSYHNEELVAKGDDFLGLEWGDCKKVTHWQPLKIRKPK